MYARIAIRSKPKVRLRYSASNTLIRHHPPFEGSAPSVLRANRLPFTAAPEYFSR